MSTLEPTFASECAYQPSGRVGRSGAHDRRAQWVFNKCRSVATSPISTTERGKNLDGNESQRKNTSLKEERVANRELSAASRKDREKSRKKITRFAFLFLRDPLNADRSLQHTRLVSHVLFSSLISRRQLTKSSVKYWNRPMSSYRDKRQLKCDDMKKDGHKGRPTYFSLERTWTDSKSNGRNQP